MLEMKITISAADLAAAINNLAAAINGGIASAEVGTFPTAGSQLATEQVNAAAAPKQMNAPLSAPVQSFAGATIPVKTATPDAAVNPTQAPGAPLSVTPAQTATQTVPTAPAAPSAPAAAPVTTAAQTPAVPTSAPQYTLDMIATAGSALIDAGKMDQLMQLLAKYGVNSLTNLPPENYGAVANDLRAMGAKI